MATTAECKEFLVDFVKANPSTIAAIYDLVEGSEDANYILELAADTKSWKRSYKGNPPDMFYELDACYSGPGAANHIRLDHLCIDKDISEYTFKSERGFEFTPTRNNITLIILEDKDDNLYLMDYRGTP